MSTTLDAPFRTTKPRRTRVGDAQAAHASDYAELSRRVKAAGLLERRYLPYIVRSALLGLALAGGVVAMVLIGQSWWQVAVAVWFGVVFAQAGFLAHDGAHRQVFTSGRKNEWYSRVVANLIVGLGYGWWMHKHSKHHANPNTLGKDMDMDKNAIIFTPQDAAVATGVPAWFMARQGWFFLPAMSLTGLDLHVKTVRMLLQPGAVKHRGVEALFIAVRLIGFPVLVISQAGLGIGLVALVVQVLLFGTLMGGGFAPNHIGMPLIDERQKVDYLRRQVLTSRNITGGRAVDFLMGGLNHQVEHHLFPSMPSANLRKLRSIVRDYCAELNIPYLERSLPGALRDVVTYIHKVGLKQADPFDCPAAAALRML